MRKAAPSRRLTICLVSSHPLVLGEFRRLLSRPGWHLQARRLETTSAPDVRRLPLPRAQNYVVDAFPSRPVTEALVAGILDRHPTARLLVLAENFSEANSLPFLRLGAKGLLTYAQAREQLPQALRAVAAGGYWVPRSLLSSFVDSVLKDVRGRRPVSGPGHLSPREQQVLDALLENLSNKEIASQLHISERTVKFHVSSLLAKFGVRRRADLILLCYQRQPSTH